MIRRPKSDPGSLASVLLLVLAGVLGCHSLKFTQPVLDKPEKTDRDPIAVAPAKYQMRLSQYLFLADFELKRDPALFRELADLRDQVQKELQLPSANTLIQVYIFEDRPRYETFMQARYPDLPKRRAFFVAQPHSVGGPEDLLVYTFWGERVRQDLRHELTHALLHSVLKDVPLWLDEGLAEYFEVPPDAQGLNVHHLEQIQLASSASFRPNLAHLEELSQVRQMTPAEYREAWAWVHLLLRDKPEAKAVLTQYLQQLRVTSNPGPLQPRVATVFPEMEAALCQHLAKLDSNRPSVPAANGS
ncbi:MAG TPA: DUF1570 domain-containing protein [Gemmataceae bacterium]|nr:DUF1570 domain-containing protein [Gemmataceae bacterium]